MNDEGECPEPQPILNRIPEEWGRSIGVGPGWHSILIELDEALAAIDPEYEILQVKQEAGDLNFRFDTTHTERYQEMCALVRDAAQRAAHLCEECGAVGVLHGSRDGNVRRLCASCAAAAQEGYRAVSRDLETRASLHRVAQQAAALHRLLTALPPDARRRITGGEKDAVSQLASHALWASTADLHEQGRSEYAAEVVARARGGAEGITELRLVTNSLDVSERFWRPIYADAAVECVGGELRVTPPVGPALLFIEAVSAHLITAIDMVVQTDAGAAERLREAGFEVAEDGRFAVDVNATDATITLEVRP